MGWAQDGRPPKTCGRDPTKGIVMRHHYSKALAAVGAAALAGTLAAGPAATAAPAPTVSPVASAATAAATVTAAVSPRAANSGQTLTFTGRSAPRAAIVVQYRQGNSWLGAGRGKAAANGTYKVAVKHARSGALTYRVAAVVGAKTVYSNGLAVRAVPQAQWYFLANYSPTSSDLYRKASTFLGDTSHMYGLYEYGWGAWSGTWRLNGACTQVTGYAGAGADDPRHNATRLVEVLAGGNRLFSKWFALGQGEEFSGSLRGANAITISVNSRGVYDAGHYGVGNVKVLCTAPPGQYDPVD